jgi:hypothetical protein
MCHPSHPEGMTVADNTRNARRRITLRESIRCTLKVYGPGQELMVSQLDSSHHYFPISSVYINSEIYARIPQLASLVGTFYANFTFLFVSFVHAIL